MLSFQTNHFFGAGLLKKDNILWTFFSSIKLTIVLLFLIIAIFIVATLIPQQDGASKIIWLSDLYHSNVFYIMMGLLSLNLIICSINRLPLSIRQYKTPFSPAPSGLFENLLRHRIILTNKKMEDVSRAVESSLASKSASVELLRQEPEAPFQNATSRDWQKAFNPQRELGAFCSGVKKTNTEKGRIFYREKGRLSLFGVYIVHLGVLIIIAGAVVGSIFGFEADINLSEGEEASIVQLVKGKGTRQLDFSVRCDKFNIEFYETGSPKTYRSDLSFIKGGQVVHQGSTLVNHPITFDGLRFYQSSYGLSEESKATLTYTNADMKSEELLVTQGTTFDLPAQKAKVTVLRVEEDIMQFGPAIKLSIETKKENIQFWVFQHIKDIAAVNPGLFSSVPLFNPGLFQPLVFSLERIEKQYYTGLRVVRDPGVPFVLAGGILLLAGMIIIFFISHQRVWILIQQEPEGITISVAGHSNRNNEVLQRQMDDLCMRIDKEIAV
jgi:cytochrome c biogenesis protein